MRPVIPAALLLLAACARPPRAEPAPRPEAGKEPREGVGQAEAPEWEPFPVEPPIEGADPATRHEQVLRLPTVLRVARDGGRVAYCIDRDQLEAVTLDVGHRMVLGYRIDWTLRRGEAAPERLGRELGTMDAFSGTAWTDGNEAGVLEAAIEVFETDIPPQHHWAPCTGRYRVLWTRTLTAPLPD